MQVPTRQQMIEDLTKYELQYLIDNQESLSEVAIFFSKNGFNLYDEQALLNAWNNKIKD